LDSARNTELELRDRIRELEDAKIGKLKDSSDRERIEKERAEKDRSTHRKRPK
jgi:hypothetical protein